ncbi:hypothetical protein BJF81_08500 [Ornithinimicrobium sp. CNJ-824]|uniref:hypothetical protein n=1 Tax=Ornithinimicrobium sp. CNJ-824 TaxID=1904966 RepID=UPI00095B051B|nr:hypothetical protein [Ornithinimicrobium sp. CNJ-824]OLT19551.1 hypothetical protein BJF81_08500 [Ornithinimicrobium sp. CNJ-824]
MRHHLVTAAGAVVGLVLAALVIVGVAQEVWTIAATAGSVLALGILVVQLDTWRRTRSLRAFVKTEIRRTAGREAENAQVGLTYARASSVTEDDVMGAVRLMQAQYTGRLDRMQRALDDALDRLSAAGAPPDTDRR